MPPKSPHPELAHPGCCTHKIAEAPSGLSVGTAPPVRPETQKAVLWGSLKAYIFWSLTFFGIYASSSVCVF